MLAAVYGWGLEPAFEAGHGDDHHDDGDGPTTATAITAPPPSCPRRRGRARGRAEPAAERPNRDARGGPRWLTPPPRWTSPLRRPTPHAHGLKPGEHGWTYTGLSNEKLGMWLFLGSECLLFGGLISTYLLYKSRVPEGHGPDARTSSTTSRSRRCRRSCC